MQKNVRIHKKTYSMHITKNLSPLNENNNLSQLEKDIFILINYIRTNPLDFSNELIKNHKNKNLTEEQIYLINLLEEKYNKEHLSPFVEISEISEAAKNLLNSIAQNDKLYKNKNSKDIKTPSSNLRNRLSNYGMRTGRIFEHIIFDIENAEDIVNQILKDENGRNMLLSNKMKYIGIGCSILPSNILCTVIDIVQDFIPFRNLVYKNNITKNINSNNDIIGTSAFSPKMNIIINNSNNNHEYIQDVMNNNHNIQRKKNIIFENNDNYKIPENEVSSIDSDEQNSYKSYNIIINNNNKIIPIRNNLNNIKGINENKNKNGNYYNFNGKVKKNQFNSEKIPISKSKSVYGFKFGNYNSNKYHKLDRKEKLEILRKINHKNNNSTVKNNANFENLIPLSPNYSKNKQKDSTNDKCTSPISPYVSKSIYSNFNSNTETDLNNLENNISEINKINELNNYFFEVNETSPSQLSSNMLLDNEYAINKMKNDLMIWKNILKEELKSEVKNELKNEIQKQNEINDKKEIINNNKIINNRNIYKKSTIYHKKYNSDFCMKNKINNNIPDNKNIHNENIIEKQNCNCFSKDRYESDKKPNNMSKIKYYQSFSNDKNLHNSDEHRIKNKNEIKKLIRLYNKEKDIKRIQENSNQLFDMMNNKIRNNDYNKSLYNFHFGYKNFKKSNNKSENISNKPNNLFFIKYQKAKPKDQAFKLCKNKTNIKNTSKISITKKIPFNNSLNKKILLEKKKYNEKINNQDLIINPYNNKNESQFIKKRKEASIEVFLTNCQNEKIKNRTFENNINDNNIYSEIKINMSCKDFNPICKSLSSKKNKIDLKFYTFNHD